VAAGLQGAKELGGSEAAMKPLIAKNCGLSHVELLGSMGVAA
jgi:hypothetical protein